MNRNENTTCQNLWSAAEIALTGKFLSINASIKNKECSQINSLNFHLKKLEKEEQIKPKASRREEIIKIRG